jgi:hypothetical protein
MICQVINLTVTPLTPEPIGKEKNVSSKKAKKSFKQYL